MMILQTIPQISITEGQPTILVPLVIVIGISAVKDIFEDLKRHSSDNKENNREIKRADPNLGRLTRDKWLNLKVG